MPPESLPPEDVHEVESAIRRLAAIDAFHGPDAIECLEAARTAVEGWRTLALSNPGALANLISTSEGQTAIVNAVGGIAACLTRVIDSLARDRARK